MMRKILPVFFAIAASAAYGYDSVQLTYRGHLKYNNVSTPRPSVVAMTFRIYADKSDQTAVWSNTVDSVELDADGFFQVALTGNGLDAVIDSGKAGYIGVTIADGKEQYPRQQLLSNTRAEKSARAERLAPSPVIGTANVKAAEFNSASAANITAGGTVSLPGTDQLLTIDAIHTKKDFVLKTKGDVTFFKKGTPADYGTALSSDGGVSFDKTATCNCAAFFTSVNSTAVPGLVQFIKKGELIALPSAFNLPSGLTVQCLVYPIGAE